MKWVTASQPQFMPQLFMLERMARVEAFVVMMEAQFDRYHVRSKISTKQGGQWFGVQCRKGRKPLNEVLLFEPEKWVKKACNQLQMNYGKALYWKEHGENVLEFIQTLQHCHDVAEVGWNCYVFASDYLGLRAKLYRSIDLIPERPADATQWMIDLTKAVHGTQYMQGKISMDSYFNRSKWEKSGIDLYYQDFTHPRAASSWIDTLFHDGMHECQYMLGNEIGDRSPTVREWT